MSNSKNKYRELFKEDMTSNEIRYVLFSNCDGLSDEDLFDLFAAYEPVAKDILSREIEESRDFLM